MALFTSSPAVARVSLPPAGTVLGFWTSRGLSNRSHPATAARSPRTAIVEYFIGRSSSVAHVDGDDPLGELRQRRLLPRAEIAATGAAEEHRFGIESGITRPGVEVAARDRDHRTPRADRADPGGGGRVRHRQLPESQEFRVVDVEVRNPEPFLGNANRIRRERPEVLEAADEDRAAHPRVAVQLLVSGLEVEQQHAGALHDL